MWLWCTDDDDDVPVRLYAYASFCLCVTENYTVHGQRIYGTFLYYICFSLKGQIPATQPLFSIRICVQEMTSSAIGFVCLGSSSVVNNIRRFAEWIREIISLFMCCDMEDKQKLSEMFSSNSSTAGYF